MTEASTKIPAHALPIVEVTVLEDRARIKRRGTLASAGTITLEGVATTLVDRTLAGYVLGRDAGGAVTRAPLGSLRTERERLHETSALPEELAALQRSAESVRHRIAGLEASLRELDAYVASLATIGKLAVDDSVLDAAHGLGDASIFRARFAALDDKSRAAREERLTLEAAVADAQAEAAAIERALAAKRQTTTRDRASLILRRSLQTSTAPYVLLAGPVELVRNGGFVGRTAIKLVAPGERFELGWGPEGALRLVREEEIHEGDPGLLSSQRVRIVDRTLRVSNLGPRPLSLEILERIPVSELEKVKITLDPKRSQKGASADEDGMVRLPLTLEARGTATVKLGFELRAASDVTGLP